MMGNRKEIKNMPQGEVIKLRNSEGKVIFTIKHLKDNSFELKAELGEICASFISDGDGFEDYSKGCTRSHSSKEMIIEIDH